MCNLFAVGTDYMEILQEVHFGVDENMKTVMIPLAEDDVFPEVNKTFEVYLSASQGVFISPFGYASAIIRNDDPPLPGRVVYPY